MGNSRHNNKGFTLMEMLITVAVTVVLLALVVPNVIKLQHDLRIMQLNESAHQVYQATQFRLSQMQSAGQLSAFESDVESTNQVTKPRAAIYPVSDTSKDKAVYYLSSSQDTNKIVSEGLFTQKTNPISKNIINGNYIILLSPSTAEVVAVYYWEGDCKIDNLQYKDVAKLKKPGLNKNNVGIYVGGDIRGEGAYDGDINLDNFYFDVVNKEELYVRVMGKGIDKLPVTGAINKNNLAIKVSVYKTSDTSNVLWSDSYLLKDLGFTDKSKEIDVVLDSMKKDQSILDKLTHDRKLSILPGDNIEVGVEIGIKNKGEIFKSEKVLNAQNDTGSKKADYIKTNALFASVDRDNDTLKNVDVRYLRHLNNLRYLNGEDVLTDRSYRYLYKPFDVTIKQDIDFDGRNWDKDLKKGEPSCVSVLGKLDENGNKLDNLNPLDVFKPVDLMYDSTNYATYSPIKSVAGNLETKKEAESGKLDLNKSDEKRIVTLKNFKIEDKDDNGTDKGYVGLFSKSTADLSHISLENPMVKGNDRVGALVGQAYFRRVYNGQDAYSNIYNCHVTAKNNGKAATGEVIGYGWVGGLVGESRSVVFNKVSVELNKIQGGDASSYVGGICGDATFDRAIFSDVLWDINDAQTIIHDITGRDRIGGICGRANSANLYSCVAGSNNGDELSISGDFLVGGMVGEALDSKIGSSKVYLDKITATGKNSEENSNVSYIGGICGDCSPISGGKDNAAYNKSDISIVEVNFNEIRGTDRVGGITGRANGGIIHDCIVKGDNVKGNFIVGGAVGESYLGKITVSQIFINNVIGLEDTSAYIGGVFGDSIGQTVTDLNVNVKGSISGNNHVGGFTGRANKIVCEGCEANIESISGKSHIGGFSGLSLASKYSGDSAECTAIKGETNVGGFVGFDGLDRRSSTYINCSANTNNITGEDRIGGFVGYAFNDTGNKQHYLNHNSNDYYYYWVNENNGYFKECSVKLGSLAGEELCGGFAGESEFNWFKDCSVLFDGSSDKGSGIVASNFYAGGFCGKQYMSAEENCKVTNDTECTIKAPYYVGGFIGYITTEKPKLDWCGSGGVQNCKLAVEGIRPFNVLATKYVGGIYASHVGGGFIGAIACRSWSTNHHYSSDCIVANNEVGNDKRSVKLYEDRLNFILGGEQVKNTGTYPLIGYGPDKDDELTGWYVPDKVHIDYYKYN